MSGLTWGKPNNTSHTGIVIFEFTKLLFVTGINADTWGRQQIAAQTQIHQCMICSSSSSLESRTYPWQWVQPMEWFCHSKWVYTRIYIYNIYIYIHTLILSLSLYTFMWFAGQFWPILVPILAAEGRLTPPSMEVTKINEPSDGHANFSTCVHQTKPIPWSMYIYIYTHTQYLCIYLVGGWPTPLKNMKVRWNDSSQYMGKSKMFQTTNQYIYIYTHMD